MKPIIVDMRDMTDSTEVYESRPNPFMVYFIYVLVALLAVALVWMTFSRIDIVVKSNGMFRSEETAVDVSCSVSGIVTDCDIAEGQYVEAGDTLFTIDAESLEAAIEDNQELLLDVEQRLEILRAYACYLNGEDAALEAYSENKYYDEFAGRKQLLELSAQNTNIDANTQKSQYQKELDNVAQLISQYESQITKLRQAEDCIRNRSNIFDVGDSYYASIVSSYISNYEVTAAQYDVQIEQAQNQIAELEQQLSAVPLETDETDATETLNQQIVELQDTITKLIGEKEAALNNLELQQIASIEQQIATIDSTLNSVKSNRSSLQAQIEVLNHADDGKTAEINRLTEEQNVAAEILSYEAKKTEYENSLKQYDMENGDATVTAATAGYIYLNQELNEGSYIAQGNTVCRILPENSSEYYAEVYVENGDIAKLKEGQEVKFEIGAYPSSEYGYFTGVVDSISKDIKVDQNSGSAYYLVKVRCEETTVTNKDGKTGTIMNGMACQAKVIVDEENVLQHLLKKLELLD